MSTTVVRNLGQGRYQIVAVTTGKVFYDSLTSFAFDETEHPRDEDGKFIPVNLADAHKYKPIPASEATRLFTETRAGSELSRMKGVKHTELPFKDAVLVNLPLNKISPRHLALLRESTDHERVQRYADAGNRHPVFADYGGRKKKSVSIADGGHRTTAALLRGDTHIPAYVPASAIPDLQKTPETLTDDDVGEILAGQHAHRQNTVTEHDETATRLKHKWTNSTEFKLMEIPIEHVKPLAATVGKSHSEGPLIVDTNPGGYGRPLHGYAPEIVIIDGKHRHAAAVARGDKTILAYVGTKAAEKLKEYK